MAYDPKMDVINVVDVEATCWNGERPDGEEQEIIQVGIVQLFPRDLKIGPTFSYLVKPETSRVSPYCTELTGITGEQLDRDGITFHQLLLTLEDKNRVKVHPWASWGDFDRVLFERQCRRAIHDYPFGKRHLNLKTLFALSYGLPAEVGLSEATGQLGLTFAGRQHDAGCDAMNTAHVLAEILYHTREGRTEQRK